MNALIELVKSEMKPSTGCTEPAAIGLAVSKTCQYLSKPAQQLSLCLSSNIFKNAYSVKIPGASRSGIPLAAALGFLLSNPANTIDLFSDIKAELVEQAQALVAQGFITISVREDSSFYIEVTAKNDTETVCTLTFGSHDTMVRVQKNGVALLDREVGAQAEDQFDITAYTVNELIDMCEKADAAQLSFLREAVVMNMALSAAGMEKAHGLAVGQAFRRMVREGLIREDLVSKVKMTVAAACDFRMGGGTGAAMTLTGSGNQGIEAFLPVAVAAREWGVSEEKQLRALLLSAVLTIYIKRHVGRLSPICGATISGSGAAGAIAWLLGGARDQIKGAVQNLLGTLAGMLCDGAKDSCALKLANCAGEAVMAAALSLEGSVIRKTDGFIEEEVEKTIHNVSRLSREGMSRLDMQMIQMMERKCSL